MKEDMEAEERRIDEEAARLDAETTEDDLHNAVDTTHSSVYKTLLKNRKRLFSFEIEVIFWGKSAIFVRLPCTTCTFFWGGAMQITEKLAMKILHDSRAGHHFDDILESFLNINESFDSVDEMIKAAHDAAAFYHDFSPSQSHQENELFDADHGDMFLELHEELKNEGVEIETKRKTFVRHAYSSDEEEEEEGEGGDTEEQENASKAMQLEDFEETEVLN